MNLGGIPVVTRWHCPYGTVYRLPEAIVMNPVNFVQITHHGEDPYKILLDQLLARITRRADALAAEATDRIDAMHPHPEETQQ